VPRTTTVECANCYTTYNHVEVHGGEAAIPAGRCFYPGCPVELCPRCEQFACDGCGHSFCQEHRIGFQGLGLCIACLQEALESNEPECTCTQTDVDLFDARGCDFHSDRSDYNRLLRMTTDRERYERIMPKEVA